MSHKILVIEDEKHIAEGIKFNLERQGMQVLLAHTGTKGIDAWKEFKPELIVLDLMLPELDGFKVLEHIRLDDEKFPILVLSARDAVEAKIRCFKKGVDDYMSKPFDLDEFLLRVERNLTRSSWTLEDAHSTDYLDVFEFGDCKIDFSNHLALTLDGEISLTIQELKLLKTFFKNPNTILSRKFLLENAFGYSADVSSRTVDNFIVRFRKYFEKDPKKPAYFKSKRAQGYIFVKN